MKRIRTDNVRFVVLAAVCIVLAIAGPAISHGVHAQFAHNADKVDGKHAGQLTRISRARATGTLGSSDTTVTTLTMKVPGDGLLLVNASVDGLSSDTQVWFCRLSRGTEHSWYYVANPDGPGETSMAATYAFAIDAAPGTTVSVDLRCRRTGASVSVWTDMTAIWSPYGSTGQPPTFSPRPRLTPQQHLR